MKSITHTFSEFVRINPNKFIFRSLEDSVEYTVTYGELNGIVQNKVQQLLEIQSGSTALLLYDDTVDFISTFLACQIRGIIAVPMFYPNNKRHFARLTRIIENAKSELALTSIKDVEKIQSGLEVHSISVNVIGLESTGVENLDVSNTPNDIAFIQYTSGSTSSPKGVIISQKNLMHNQKMIQEAFGCNQNSVILSWLPFYHDMGLIGSLLHTIYTGCTCVLMKPASVVKNPLSWFHAIQKYKVTHTGGPNFIYDAFTTSNAEHFGDLNLSSIEVMYNGSEPIKAKTVQAFIDKYARFGLPKDTYKTCYGLAEATLIVSGGNPQFVEDAVSSGVVVSELDVVLFDNDAHEVRTDKGEICISGNSVTEGYWNMNSASFFVDHNGKRYFKTGDLGHWNGDHLMVDGRLKEMLIINGQNIFPYDLELEVSKISEAILENGVSISEEDGKLFIFAEIDRSFIRAEDAFFETLRNKVDKELIDSIGIDSESVVFVFPRALPRTSSGKIRRNEMYSLWQKGELNSINEGVEVPNLREFNSENFDWTAESVENYLVNLISEKLRISDKSAVFGSTLFELGLSSIKAVEITNTISQELGVDLDLERVYELNDVSKVAKHILDEKWLSTATNKDTEIEL